MPSTATFSIEDYSHEMSTTTVNVMDITSLNYGDVSDGVDDIETAVQGISTGVLRRTTISKGYVKSAAEVTDPNAQRERKWLVTYRDVLPFLDAGSLVSNPGYLKTFNLEIPSPDLSLLVPGTDRADFEATEIAAFVTQFEAHARSPYNTYSVIVAGPFVEITDIRVVGRNV